MKTWDLEDEHSCALWASLHNANRKCVEYALDHGDLTYAGANDDIAPNMVDHPPHYELNGPPCEGCGRPIQCIEIREDMAANISDATKYLWRHGDKDGADPIEDLKKSIFYIQREIKRMGRQR